MIRSRFVIAAFGAALVAMPAMAQHMNAETFFQRATKLKKKGPLAMLSVGEVKALVNEVKKAGAQVKAARLAAEEKGGKGRYCPPKKAQRMSSDEFYDRIAAIPQAERAKIDMVEAMNRMPERKHPCPR